MFDEGDSLTLQVQDGVPRRVRRRVIGLQSPPVPKQQCYTLMPPSGEQY